MSQQAAYGQPTQREEWDHGQQRLLEESKESGRSTDHCGDPDSRQNELVAQGKRKGRVGAGDEEIDRCLVQPLQYQLMLRVCSRMQEGRRHERGHHGDAKHQNASSLQVRFDELW